MDPVPGDEIRSGFGIGIMIFRLASSENLPRVVKRTYGIESVRYEIFLSSIFYPSIDPLLFQFSIAIPEALTRFTWYLYGTCVRVPDRLMILECTFVERLYACLRTLQKQANTSTSAIASGNRLQATHGTEKISSAGPVRGNLRCCGHKGSPRTGDPASLTLHGAMGL